MKSIILLAGLMLCHASFCMKMIDEGVENKLPVQVAGQVATAQAQQSDSSLNLKLKILNIVHNVQDSYKEETIYEQIEQLMPLVREYFGSDALPQILLEQIWIGTATDRALFRCCQEVSREKERHWSGLFIPIHHYMPMTVRLLKYGFCDEAINLINKKSPTVEKHDFHALLKHCFGKKVSPFRFSNAEHMHCIARSMISRGKVLFGPEGFGNFLIAIGCNDWYYMFYHCCHSMNCDISIQVWRNFFLSYDAQFRLLVIADEHLLSCNSFYKYIAANKEKFLEITTKYYNAAVFVNNVTNQLNALKLAVHNSQLFMDLCATVRNNLTSQECNEYGDHMTLYFLRLMPSNIGIIKNNPWFYRGFLERSPVKQVLADVITNHLYNNPIFMDALNTIFSVFFNTDPSEENLLVHWHSSYKESVSEHYKHCCYQYNQQRNQQNIAPTNIVVPGERMLPSSKV